MTTSQELDRAQERADKTAADLRRTEAELRVTRVSIESVILFWYAMCFIVCRKPICAEVAIPLKILTVK